MKHLDTNDRPNHDTKQPISQRLFRQLVCLTSLLVLTAAACGGGPIGDSVICCELADGTVSSETTSDCKELGGAVVDEELCECDDEVCCELADGTFQTLPESQCETIASPDRCLDVSPTDEVCCKSEDGYQTVPATECSDEQTVSADFCSDEDVCCRLADGTFQTLPASQCTDAQTVSADFCSDEDVCCRLADGTFQTLPASQCDSVSPDPDLCLGAETCCRIDGQFVTVPVGDCPQGQVAPADMCIDDPDVCCGTAIGFETIPASECPDDQELSPDMCRDVCCETAAGVQFVPAAQCGAAQTLDDAVCNREVCCATIDGYEMQPQGLCPPAQVSDPLMCQEEVCCKTADGNAFVPANQCEPMSVVDDELCITPDTECIKFRAVDMSSLPYTTTTGETLQSFNSFWGTFPVQTGWSSSCLDQPMGAERAVAGVGNDLTLNFASPVSSIYLLRYHAQPGDELVVPGANLTPTFCGASSYHNITQVDLATPSTSVTVQDISPGGGTGYSVLLAECVEWGQN